MIAKAASERGGEKKNESDSRAEEFAERERGMRKRRGRRAVLCGWHSGSRGWWSAPAKLKYFRWFKAGHISHSFFLSLSRFQLSKGCLWESNSLLGGVHACVSGPVLGVQKDEGHSPAKEHCIFKRPVTCCWLVLLSGYAETNKLNMNKLRMYCSRKLLGKQPPPH